MDEADLSRRLANDDGNEKSSRVVHDVDCIAGILTQRKGQVSDSLDTASAIFVSDSGSTVRTVRGWYAAQGGRGCAPIVHVLTLSNFAWLKRPASASKLKVHELMALCSAALRPTPEAWQHFIDHLRRLEAEGELNDEEITAIVASELTENLLAERGIDAESDATSLTEVVERVKSGYEEERAAAKRGDEGDTRPRTSWRRTNRAEGDLGCCPDSWGVLSGRHWHREPWGQCFSPCHSANGRPSRRV